MDPLVETPEAGPSDAFRHVAFIAAVLLLLGAWKFGLEGILE